MAYAIQLYSVREMLKQDYMGTLKYLADLGYDGVEFFGGVEANCGYSTKEIKDALEFLGLEAVSAHVGFEVLSENFDFITDYYKEIGVKCIVCPWVYEEQIDTPEKATDTAKRFVEFAEKCLLKGLEFAYHNHTHEFEKFSEDVTALDVVLDASDPLVLMQIDVAWAQKAGVYSAPEFIRKNAGKVTYLHLKQYIESAEGKRGAKISTLDKGNVDIKECVRVGKMMGCEWFIVEFDSPLLSEKEDAKINVEFLKSIH